MPEKRRLRHKHTRAPGVGAAPLLAGRPVDSWELQLTRSAQAQTTEPWPWVRLAGPRSFGGAGGSPELGFGRAD